MGKKQFCVPALLGVFIFLFIFVPRIEAFNFFPYKINRNSEHFQKQLQKLCDFHIKMHEKFGRYPIPRICKTRDTNPPTLEFNVEPQSIVKGETVTLSWASDNTFSCEASDGWRGDKSLSGEKVVHPKKTKTYTLTCDGVNDGIEKSVTVTVTNPLPPPPPSEEPVDVCPNIPDIQTSIPAGYHDENGQCVVDVIPPTDVCLNIDGVQETVPAGYHLDNNQCVVDEVLPADMCPNLDGVQESVPAGYHLDNGSCIVDVPEIPACIDINTASAEELDEIVHVGLATANKIIGARPFSSVEDLSRIGGFPVGGQNMQDILEQGLACVLP
jgi:hypothetical protein